MAASKEAMSKEVSDQIVRIWKEMGSLSNEIHDANIYVAKEVIHYNKEIEFIKKQLKAINKKLAK